MCRSTFINRTQYHHTGTKRQGSITPAPPLQSPFHCEVTLLGDMLTSNSVTPPCTQLIFSPTKPTPHVCDTNLICFCMVKFSFDPKSLLRQTEYILYLYCILINSFRAKQNADKGVYFQKLNASPS